MAEKIDREPRDGARRVKFGDRFTSDELADGLVVLEEVMANQNPPPEGQQVEPWGLGDDAPEEKHRLFSGRLREYLRRHGHGDQ